MNDPRALSLQELRRKLEDLLGPLPEDPARWRALLEESDDHQRVDRWLLALRDLEAASEGIPMEVAGLRRTRVWSQDPISVTFEGWDRRTGDRVAMRVLRPALRRDPVWRRRLARSPRWMPNATVCAPTRLLEGDWPALITVLEGPSLADLLPVEDRLGPQDLAKVLVGGLAGLAELHRLGLVHGTLGPEHLVFTAEGVKLVWLDALLVEATAPHQDLASLGRAVAALSRGDDAVSEFARALASAPPPDVQTAQDLLSRTLSEDLADRRHMLALRHRDRVRREREAGIWNAVTRLSAALPPPEGRFVLRAGRDRVLVVAESDGVTVRGGPVAGLPARFMPTVWKPESGLDPVASRALLRAWASRKTGDEERRASLQAELGGDDENARLLCRWLSCQARLRAVRLLLELGGSA